MKRSAFDENVALALLGAPSVIRTTTYHEIVRDQGRDFAAGYHDGKGLAEFDSEDNLGGMDRRLLRWVSYGSPATAGTHVGDGSGYGDEGVSLVRGNLGTGKTYGGNLFVDENGSGRA